MSIYVADLKTIGGANVVWKHADDTTLIVPEPEVCDAKSAKTEGELEIENIMKWSNVNKLQLNLVKYKNCVQEFKCATGYPANTDQQQLECVRCFS